MKRIISFVRFCARRRCAFRGSHLRGCDCSAVCDRRRPHAPRVPPPRSRACRSSGIFGGVDSGERVGAVRPPGRGSETLCRHFFGYAVRMLRKNPGFAGSAHPHYCVLDSVLNTAIFSAPNGLASPLISLGAGASRVVSLSQTFSGHVERNVHGMSSFFSASEHERCTRDRNRSLSGLLVYSTRS